MKTVLAAVLLFSTIASGQLRPDDCDKNNIPKFVSEIFAGNPNQAPLARAWLPLRTRNRSAFSEQQILFGWSDTKCVVFTAYMTKWSATLPMRYAIRQRIEKSRAQADEDKLGLQEKYAMQDMIEIEIAAMYAAFRQIYPDIPVDWFEYVPDHFAVRIRFDVGPEQVDPQSTAPPRRER